MTRLAGRVRRIGPNRRIVRGVAGIGDRDGLDGRTDNRERWRDCRGQRLRRPTANAERRGDLAERHDLVIRSSPSSSPISSCRRCASTGRVKPARLANRLAAGSDSDGSDVGVILGMVIDVNLAC